MSASDKNTSNVAALTASIHKLVSQFLSNGNITNTTASIKKAITAAATTNTAAIGAISASATDATASSKVTADATTARVRPTENMFLHPGAHVANEIIDYSTTVGTTPYTDSTMPLLGELWDHIQGNTLSL